MVSDRMGRRDRSSSTETTRPARRESSWVRGPMPGPTSSTPQEGEAPDASAISRGTQSSTRKFCPMDLEK